MAGQRRTGHPGAAGDQHGGLRQPAPAPAEHLAEPGRHGQHHLADVAGLADIPVGRRRAAHVECLERQRCQHTLLQQSHDFGQHRRGAVGAGLHQIERPIARPAVPLRDDVRVTHVGLAHLDEPPAGGQQPQRRVGELAGQRVEHDVDPGPAGGREELLLEVRAARIADVVVVESHRAQGVPLAAAGGGEHLGAVVAGQLHRGHAHSAGGGVHQHPLAGPQPGQHRQPVQRRQEHHRHARRRHQRQTRRHRGQQSLIHHRFGPDHPQQPHHRVADGQAGHRGPHLHDHTGAFGAQPAAAGIHAQGHQHIPEVDPDRGHRDPHLPVRQFRSRAPADHQVPQRALAAGVQPPRPGRQPERRAGPRRPQPGRMGHTLANHHLWLAARDYRPGVQGSVGVDQHQAARMLGLRRPHEAPHRRAGQVRNVLPGQGHGPVGLHGQHPAALTVQPGLQHRQRLGDRRVHRLHHVAAVFARLPQRDLVTKIVAAQCDRRPDHVEQPRGLRGAHRRAQLPR
ncbi:hypothetical protein PICSAR10_03555 [Mycobacterium avium subsp. paratuberculosis]|nr:hypothetical protein PICSAR10_03555 [Mycobacterium avium subsp. paratuberculosis]